MTLTEQYFQELEKIYQEDPSFAASAALRWVKNFYWATDKTDKVKARAHAGGNWLKDKAMETETAKRVLEKQEQQWAKIRRALHGITEEEGDTQ